MILLSVYDLCSQPLSIGDVLVFQQGARIVADMYGLEQIDFCFAFDNDIPHADSSFHDIIAKSSYQSQALRLSSLLKLNAKTRSVLILDSYKKLSEFIHNRGNPDLMWPSMEQIAKRTYCYYEANHLIHSYWLKHRRIPQICMPENLIAWSDDFFSKFAQNRVPVTVNLRNNPSIAMTRNCQKDEWLGFFRACESKYPVTFIVLCDISEVDPELHGLSNVIIAKDKGSSLEQDLALIMRSAFHMGSSSGPASLATFKETPYFIANCDCVPHIHLYSGAFVLSPDGKVRTAWATPYQAFSVKKESMEELLDSFLLIWESQDWMKNFRQVS